MESRSGNRPWFRERPSLRVMELENTESGGAWSIGVDRKALCWHRCVIESRSLRVVDATGRIVREAGVANDSHVSIEWFRGLESEATRIGLEPGWCRRGRIWACAMRNCRSN